MQMPKSLSFGGSSLRDVRDPAEIAEVVNHNNAILEGMYRVMFNDINLAKTEARQIADDAITTIAITDGSITTDKIDVAAVIASKIAEDAVEEAKIIAGAVTAAKTSLTAINSTTGAVNADHIVAAMIAEDAVEEAKIIAGAVTATKTSLAAINSTTGAVNADHIVAAMIDVAGLDGTSGAVTADHIEAAMIKENAVEEAKIKADAVTALKIAVSGLDGTTGNVATNHIIAGMIQSNAIESAKIKDDAVITAKILNDAIVAAKIAVSGLDGTSGDVATNHIVAGMLQTDCVESNKILANAVTAAKIDVVGLHGTDGYIQVSNIASADSVTGGINTYATTRIDADNIVISNSTGANYITGGINAHATTNISAGKIVVSEAAGANVLTGGINTYATTLIAPGKVLISGAVHLDDWSHGSDATMIDGGDIYANSVTASKLSSVAHILDNGTWSDGTDGGTGVGWADFDMIYDGAKYDITNSSTTDKWIWWDKSLSTTTFQTSATKPTVTDEDCLVCINIAGTHYQQWDATVIHGSAIDTGSINTDEIAADAITAAKINVTGLIGGTGQLNVGDATQANVITAGINANATTNIAPGKVLISGAVNLDNWSHDDDATLIDGGDIYAGSVTATKIKANDITADQMAANSIVAAALNISGIDNDGYVAVVHQTSADNITAGVNTYAATLIQAGKILISGSTNLDNWSHGSDATKIDGGDIYAQSITASEILAETITTDKLFIANIGSISNQLGNLLAGSLTGTVITGGTIQTATSGKRIKMDSTGIKLLHTTGSVGIYGTTGNGGSNITYGTTGNGGDNHLYGTGILGSINHSTENVPFKVESEQIYGDFHGPERTSAPSGASEVGDEANVNGQKYICTTAGTPGTWEPAVRYISRGDPAAFDKAIRDFTTDGTWRDLDISSIVGTGVRFVHVRISVEDNAASSQLALRENGNSNGVNVVAARTQVSGVVMEVDGWVMTDSSGVIEYHGTNLAFTAINLLIRGWWILD